MTSPSPSNRSAAFVTTQWTQVLQARGATPEARTALSDLCAAYYAPVLAFVRRSTSGEDVARDLTQEFFARILGRQGLDTVEPGRGRFRSFLLAAVRHFLADARDHDRRLKRGAGQTPEPLDAGTDTSPGLEVPDRHAPSPEDEYDRKWALTVLDRALAALADECAREGKTSHFQALKPWLTGDAGTLSQAEAGAQIGLSEGAVKVAVHRLRCRFRDWVKAEIAGTLQDPSQTAHELDCLVVALSTPR